MSVTSRSTLKGVACSVAAALRRARIRAVLTGGACASLHSGGAVQSYDLDFVLESAVTTRELDKAMQSIGFTRKGRHYTHPSTKFLVEFPPGPLGIGRDIGIRPTTVKLGASSVRILSATDSCRDRLAAFYHWNDRQSLLAAVQIARRKRVNLKAIREWSVRENAETGFMEFSSMLTPKGVSRPRRRRVER